MERTTSQAIEYPIIDPVTLAGGLVGSVYKKLARSALTTRAEVATQDGAIVLDRTIGKGAEIAQAKAYISKYKNLPGRNYTNVVMHGEEFNKMSFWEVGKYLNYNNVNGNMRFWICNGGANSRAMGLLAKRRGINILASEYRIVVTPSTYYFEGAATSFNFFGFK